MEDILGIIGVFMVFPGLFVLLAYLISRHRHLERMRMIEKGMPVFLPASDAARSAVRLRLWGIILVTFGLGVWLTSLTRLSLEVPGIVRLDRPAYAPPAGAAIPLMVGAGLLLDYWLRTKERSRSENGRRVQDPNFGEQKE
jgi:hypothetical protein